MKKIFKTFMLYTLIVFFTLLLGISIIEIFNYLSFSNTTSYYVWPPNFEYVFYPNSSVFQGIEGKSLFTINRLGYRGVEFENAKKEYRILVTGGSTTECLYLDNEETWSHILMDKLKRTKEGKKVITLNIAKSGHGIRNNILALKYLPDDYNPDLIVMLAGANDMLFKLSRKNAWRPFNETEYDNTESYTFSLYPGYGWKSTTSYRIYKSLELEFSKTKPQDAIGETLVENRIKRKNAKIWIDEKPDLNQSLEDYERSLNRVINLSKENNAKIIFITQPYLWKVNLSKQENASLWMTYDFGNEYYPIETMIYSMDAYNKKLLEVCKNNKDIYCIDLEKEMPKSLDYFYDDMHFNEKGARFVAEIVSSYIRENLSEFK